MAKIEERRRYAVYIRDCWEDMKSIPSSDADLVEMERLVENNPIQLESSDTVEKALNSCSIESGVDFNDVMKIVNL